MVLVFYIEDTDDNISADILPDSIPMQLGQPIAYHEKGFKFM